MLTEEQENIVITILSDAHADQDIDVPVIGIWEDISAQLSMGACFLVRFDNELYKIWCEEKARVLSQDINSNGWSTTSYNFLDLPDYWAKFLTAPAMWVKGMEVGNYLSFLDEEPDCVCPDHGPQSLMAMGCPSAKGKRCRSK